MRAVVMRGRELIVDQVVDPEPGRGEVLVKSLACGICGSDLHALQFAEAFVKASQDALGIFVMDLSADIVMGHEFCAEVVAYGPDTEPTIAPGARVVAVPGILHDGGFETVGYSNDYPGGFAELMLLQASSLIPVPDHVPTEHAALTEPMAVGLHAVRIAGFKPDDAAVVLGCGPVGLAAIGAARLDGVSPIVAADFSAKRRELALAMGADEVVDPGEREAFDVYRELRGDRPAVVLECVGTPGMIERAMEGATPRSQIVVVGVCMVEDQIRPSIGIEKQLSIRFSLGYTPQEFAEAFEAIADGRLDVGPLVTDTVPLDGVAGAFKTLADPQEHAKIVVLPHS